MELIKTLVKFTVVPDFKEIGLAIARNATNLKDFKGTLVAQGFVETKDPTLLFRNLALGGKFYFVISESFSKDLRDIITQYRTGQVELFDTKSMTSQAITPDYKNLSVMFLADEKTFISLSEMERELLLSIGPVYRS